MTGYGMPVLGARVADQDHLLYYFLSNWWFFFLTKLLSFGLLVYSSKFLFSTRYPESLRLVSS